MEGHRPVLAHIDGQVAQLCPGHHHQGKVRTPGEEAAPHLPRTHSHRRLGLGHRPHRLPAEPQHPIHNGQQAKSQSGQAGHRRQRSGLVAPGKQVIGRLHGENQAVLVPQACVHRAGNLGAGHGYRHVIVHILAIVAAGEAWRLGKGAGHGDPEGQPVHRIGQALREKGQPQRPLFLLQNAAMQGIGDGKGLGATQTGAAVQDQAIDAIQTPDLHRRTVHRSIPSPAAHRKHQLLRLAVQLQGELHRHLAGTIFPHHGPYLHGIAWLHRAHRRRQKHETQDRQQKPLHIGTSFFAVLYHREGKIAIILPFSGSQGLHSSQKPKNFPTNHAIPRPDAFWLIFSLRIFTEPAIVNTSRLPSGPFS